ncbi:MAG TPA: DUF4242 domain-containing protein [Jiangellaceae bacterium]|nr:DUF4242 domain-containing protein [Jiangellaceae bacterium]
MPRYLVQRTFADGLDIPVTPDGARTCRSITDGNAAEGVTWLQSYVTIDKSMTYCVCDGPSPEAVRRAAAATDLPVDRITEVRVLDPYFYH